MEKTCLGQTSEMGQKLTNTVLLLKMSHILNLPANSVAPPLLSSISQGGFTGFFFYLGHFTAKAFSYIRTAFGASRSMRVGVRLAKQ